MHVRRNRQKHKPPFRRTSHKINGPAHATGTTWSICVQRYFDFRVLFILEIVDTEEEELTFRDALIFQRLIDRRV